MAEHPQLAKNIIPNCGQGRAVANRLWEQLSTKLNTAGPPIKEVKSWRKVFTDQKHQVKKKLSFNMASKKKTGGGPYEEMPLTPAEEQILQAAGLEASVEGLSSIKSFGSSKVIDNIMGEIESSGSSENSGYENIVKETDKENSNVDMECENLQKEELMVNKKCAKKSQNMLNLKLDRLLNLMERLNELKTKSLKLKEDEHVANMAIKTVDLEIKTLELEMLKQRV
ncbi:uncharacterized protein LOC119614145 [Lucilia sericata]|uniref:uncharacterized protein LOC119614145 n=1 Tax=Lucilia sericata TaxID=13632 RepID=UPI0018A81AB3|nr:uncharacterized protein LOC119614145 [Lucilia sericata]